MHFSGILSGTELKLDRSWIPDHCFTFTSMRNRTHDHRVGWLTNKPPRYHGPESLKYNYSFRTSRDRERNDGSAESIRQRESLTIDKYLLQRKKHEFEKNETRCFQSRHGDLCGMNVENELNNSHFSRAQTEITDVGETSLPQQTKTK